MSSTPTRTTRWSYALRSFIGFLEGTGKSANTIQSYRSDLVTFEEFLKRNSGKNEIHLARLGMGDLDRYRGHLAKAGYRTNTRRRKILTAHRFLKYLAGRNRLDEVMARKIPAPHKVERVPRVVPFTELRDRILALPLGSEIERRNRALLWLLAETGLQVSEVGLLKPADVLGGVEGSFVDIPGKSARRLAISDELRLALEAAGSRSEGTAIFRGFNKYGPITGAITARAVELLVKAYLPRLGFEDITPRTFRHSIVVHWHASGVERDEIRRRLGLKTDYAFRSYEPLFRGHKPEDAPSAVP